MDRYAVLANILALARECLEPFECPYDVFVSRGDAPDDCSALSAYWASGQVLDSSNKCATVVEETLIIKLTRCCIGGEQLEFDPVREDDEARCFLKDFGLLFECLLCRAAEVLGPLSSTCGGPYIDTALAENAVAGGCYSGSIRIRFERVQNCCLPLGQ